MVELAGWGNYPRKSCRVVRPAASSELSAASASSMIARGLGRSYGDAALNSQGAVVLTERLDHLLSFDRETGLLEAEAGMSLATLIPLTVEGGWMFPVVPGTRFVTLGGCVAADIHGKSHHRDGSFGNTVLELALLLADGTRVRCSRDKRADLFWATIGGMGLTGMITEVRVQLQRVSSAIVEEQIRVGRNLEETLDQVETSSAEDPYSIAWFDLLAGGDAFGRGIVSGGRFVEGERRLRPLQIFSVPVEAPNFLLNRPALRAFNHLYFQMKAGALEKRHVPMGAFFFPLDALGNWNRLYGRRGFIQYQLVLPLSSVRDGFRTITDVIRSRNCPVYLTTVKKFGPEGEGLLSFPMEGYTMALDMPWQRNLTEETLRELDRIVIDFGGRVYLAKDARLAPQTFRTMYPRYPNWRAVKISVDPEFRFSSELSRRLEMESDAT